MLILPLMHVRTTPGRHTVPLMIDMMNAKDRGLDNGVVRTADNTTPTTCEENLQ